MDRDQAGLPVAPGAIPLASDRPLRRVGRALWDNRGTPVFAAELLHYGVCSDCSLGASGLRDDAQRGLHLCGLRLEGLRRWTRSGFLSSALPGRGRLERMDPAELQALGRVSEPMLLRRGDERFESLEWNDALKLASSRLNEARGNWSLEVDDRSSSNETLFGLSRLVAAHQPRSVSLAGSSRHAVALDLLADSLGLAAGTASLGDLGDTDLVLLWGSALPQHPVLGKLLVKARANGARVLSVQAPDFQDPESVALPSSLVRGRTTARAVDATVLLSAREQEQLAWQLVHAALSAESLDRAFLADRTDCFSVRGDSVEALAAGLGDHLGDSVCRAGTDFLRAVLGADRAVVLIGSSRFDDPVGDHTLVGALIALCLVRGWVGRAGSGILLTGGGASAQGARDLALVGQKAGAGADGDGTEPPMLRYCVGSGTDSATDHARERLESSSVATRIHQACFLDPSMLRAGADEVLVFPVQSPFEQSGGSTWTSLDRQVRFSPEIQGHPVGDVWPAWQIPVYLGQRLPGDACRAFDDLETIIGLREAMSQLQPAYAPLPDLREPGDRFQWGGPRLYEKRFETADGRARFPWPDEARPGD